MAGLRNIKGKAAAGQPAAAAYAAETDTAAPPRGPGEDVAEKPEGDAVTAPDPAKAATAGADALATDAGSGAGVTGLQSAGPQEPDGAPVAVLVEALVTRRRGGQAWAAGDKVEFAVGALTDEQLAQLLADPGFRVTPVVLPA